MSWRLCIVTFSIVNAVTSISRPVYKIVLTQKGFTQFLQYDVETPPIREFTFCTWLRVFDLSTDQSIFAYVANDNDRVVRLWLDKGGRNVKISINGRTSSSTSIDMSKDSWRHLCLSYQSDYGAWALYIDGRLASCEAAHSLYGFVLPRGGSVIIGYGAVGDALLNGLEGEIFGTNMILSSTIERNYTLKRDPQFQQKLFQRNKVTANNNVKYIVLGDMTIDTIAETSETTNSPSLNSTRSFIRIKNAKNLIEHDVGLDLSPKNSNLFDLSEEKEILDLSVTNHKNPKESRKIDFWNLLNEVGNVGKFKGKINKSTEQSGSGTQELPTISEFETPPPPISFQDYIHSSSKINKPIIKYFSSLKGKETPPRSTNNNYKERLSVIETPPPPDKNAKVYGQWTSSQFANSVLNYLKNVNFKTKEQKKIPATIPLIKLSDSFPYASDFKITKIQPPFKFPKRNFMDKRIDIQKRDIKYPQINVEIVQNDLRSQILESHSRTHPENVEVTVRGQAKSPKNEHRFYRHVFDKFSSYYDNSETLKPRPFTVAPDINVNKSPLVIDLYKNSNLMTILPFLKSAEYFVEGYNNKKDISNNDMYTKTLSNANKWHNVKSYNNDYTPRHINTGSGETQDFLEKKIEEVNKKYPSIRLKYVPGSNKLISNVDDSAILEGRALANEISNLSNVNLDSVSILKYNHGFLPGHEEKLKNTNLKNIPNHRNKNNDVKNNFNQHVKLGNALNERHVIGNNEKQKKQSFVGGDEKIPDIHRYRSDIDRESDRVPPSLGPQICKNVELYERLFFVQPDGSVDVTNILSPVKEKNLGIEFIMQNYKKCSLEESFFKNSYLLFIDWSKTPVRLFGGALPKRTTDLCGFF